MSLSVDLHHRAGAFELRAAFASGPGVTAIFGPSGAGKSMIVNAISGLVQPREGRITLGDVTLYDSAAGINIPPHKRRIGYVFQDGRLFPHLSVERNIRFGARFARGGLDHAREAELIELLDLGPLLTRRPGALSGGEKQRVALARALLSDPGLLLMDEPLAALDGPRKDEILPFLDALHSRVGMPVVYVSHSMGEVARLADHMVILQHGRVVCDGPALDVLADPAVLPFVGVREAGAVLPVIVAEHTADGLTRLTASGGELLLPGIEAEPGDLLRIRVLAQDVLLSREQPSGLASCNILPVTVEDLRRGDGPGMAVRLRFGKDRLLVRLTARSAEALDLRPGLECFAVLKATSVPRGSIGRRVQVESG